MASRIEDAGPRHGRAAWNRSVEGPDLRLRHAHNHQPGVRVRAHDATVASCRRAAKFHDLSHATRAGGRYCCTIDTRGTSSGRTSNAWNRRRLRFSVRPSRKCADSPPRVSRSLRRLATRRFWMAAGLPRPSAGFFPRGMDTDPSSSAWWGQWPCASYRKLAPAVAAGTGRTQSPPLVRLILPTASRWWPRRTRPPNDGATTKNKRPDPRSSAAEFGFAGAGHQREPSGIEPYAG